jgi:excinuclease ABC subunit A
LQFVIDLLEKEKGLAPTNWNDRATIEVKAEKGLGWFLHARSGGEWLLALCFRVRKNEFQTEALDASLGLKPLDEMNDVEAYGREPRVKARDLKTAWQEVTIKVWKKSEIDTPEFRSFLKQAFKSYMTLSQAEAKNPDDLMPWKVLGRKWHLMRKGLPGSGRVPWEFGLLEILLPTLEKALEDYQVDYGIRSKINWSRLKDNQTIVELHTKRSDGADLIVYAPAGEITVGSIATIGASQEISPHKGEMDQVRIRFETTTQAKSKQLLQLLSKAIKLMGQ